MCTRRKVGSNEKRCAHLEIPLVATFTKTLTLELARSLAPVAKTLALPLGKKKQKAKKRTKTLNFTPLYLAILSSNGEKTLDFSYWSFRCHRSLFKRAGQTSSSPPDNFSAKNSSFFSALIVRINLQFRFFFLVWFFWSLVVFTVLNLRETGVLLSKFVSFSFMWSECKCGCNCSAREERPLNSGDIGGFLDDLFSLKFAKFCFISWVGLHYVVLFVF